MLFSVTYKSSHKQEADEIKCPYNQLGLLWEFIKDHPDKRYIIQVDEIGERTFEQIDIIKDGGCNYTVECGRLQTLEVMLDRGYPAYWVAPTYDWETLTCLQDKGVSDICVDGPLGFQTKALAEIKKTTRIRISPCNSLNVKVFGAAANSFYILPQDLPLYEDAVTSLDFNSLTQDAEDALFSIYKRGSFDNFLDILIPNLPHVPCPLVAEEFGQNRLNCQQVCKIPGRTCHFCEHYLHFIETTTDYFQSTEIT